MSRFRYTLIIALYSSIVAGAVFLYVTFRNGIPQLESLPHVGGKFVLLWLIPMLGACLVSQLFFGSVRRTLRKNKAPWILSLIIMLISYLVFTTFPVAMLDIATYGVLRSSAISLGAVMSIVTFAFTFWLSIPVAIVMAFHLLSANKKTQPTANASAGL